MNKLNVLLFLCVLTIVSCRTDNKDKILTVDWVFSNQVYDVVIKDSTIKFIVPDSNKNLIESEYTNNLVLKIKRISKTKIYTTGDKNHYNDSISYGIRYVEDKPILILNFIFTILKMPKVESLTFTTNSEVKLSESKNFNTPTFDIDSFKLDDTISLDSISYFSNFFNRYSLLRNPDIEFQVIGNKIVSITKNNIKEYEINDILKSTDLKFNKKHFKISDSYYIWVHNNGDFIQLGVDMNNKFDGINMFYSLNYSNSSVKNLAMIEFKDDEYYENIKKKKEKVINIMTQIENNSDLVSMSNKISKVLLIDNKYCDAYFVKGQLSKIQKKFISAENEFKKCIEINPYHTDAIFELGILYFDQRKYDDFVKYMERVIDINPNKHQAYRALTIYYYDVRKDKETGCMYAKLAYENGDNQMLNIINELCK